MDSPRGRILLMERARRRDGRLSATTVAALRPLPRLHGLPDLVPFGRPVRPADRADPGVRRGATTTDRTTTRLRRALIFATVPHPRRLRLALALTPPRLPGPLAPFADTEAAVALGGAAAGDHCRRRRAPAARRAAARLRAAGRLRGRQRRDRPRARGRRVRGGRAARAGVLRGAAPPRRTGRGGPPPRRRFWPRRSRDVDAIVVNAAGCGSHLKDVAAPGPGRRHHRVARRARAAGRAARACRCGSRTRTRATSGTRRASATRRARVLGSIPGLELVEPAEQAICCGSAGIYNLVQPERRGSSGERKAANVAGPARTSTPSANPGCLVQVTRHLRRAGRRAAGASTRSSSSTRRSAASVATGCSAAARR